MNKKIILVDEQDQVIGYEEKIDVHKKGLRHRAFSVFIFNDSKQLLIQQRQHHKYHCGGLWSNTCCSHPYPDEPILVAGQRRLHEEMGIDIPLQKAGVFHYIAKFDNGLIENEVDHVLVGMYQHQPIAIHPDEVSAYAWIAIAELQADLKRYPKKYTPWLEQGLKIALDYPETIA